MMPPALLLIAHGSRNREANEDLVHVASALKAGGRDIVEPAYLELAAPTIAESGDRCVALGAETVVLVPWFLSAGVHVRRDLAEARRLLAGKHPAVRFHLAEPLGRHPLLLDVVAERVAQALLTSESAS